MQMMMALSLVLPLVPLLVLGGYVDSAFASAGTSQSVRLSLQGTPLALPQPHQAHFQSQEIGCFFHFGMNTFTGFEHGPGGANQPAGKYTAPANTSTDQWVRTCKSLGGTYAVFTSKHEEGFMNFYTNATDYTIEHTPFCAARKALGRECDLVAEFLASCDKYGLERGLYYTEANGDCKTHQPPIENCNAMLREAFTDLATKYGPVKQWWFDHGDGLFLDLILKYQPDSVVLGREWDLVGTEGGFVRYGLPQWYPAFTKPVKSGGVTPAVNYTGFSGSAISTSGSPFAPSWRARQCDTSLAGGWFYHNNGPTRSPSDGVDTYYMQCVGMGAGLILNMPPSTRGVLDPSFVSWASNFSDEVTRRYGYPLAVANGTVGTSDTGEEPRAGLVLDLPKGCQAVDTIIVREDLSLGQRVASYILEYKPCGLPRGSTTFEEIGSGSTVGTKRVFPLIYGSTAYSVQAAAIRFRPTLSVAMDGHVHIAELSAHNSNWTNTSRFAPPNPHVTCFAYQG